MAETPLTVLLTRVVYLVVAVFLAAVVVTSLVVHDQDPPMRVVPIEQTRPAGSAGNMPGTIPPMTVATYPGGNGSTRMP